MKQLSLGKWHLNFEKQIYFVNPISNQQAINKGHTLGLALAVPSSEPVATTCVPLFELAMLLTKEECPFSFLTLTPTSASHTAPCLSVAAVNIILLTKFEI